MIAITTTVDLELEHRTPACLPSVLIHKHEYTLKVTLCNLRNVVPMVLLDEIKDFILKNYHGKMILFRDDPLVADLTRYHKSALIAKIPPGSYRTLASAIILSDWPTHSQIVKHLWMRINEQLESEDTQLTTLKLTTAGYPTIEYWE